MAVLEGRSPAERNKLIAAVVLGVLALVSLWFAFGPRIGGTSTSVSVTVSPTPRTGSSPNRELGPVKMPSKAEQDLAYMVPVVYNRGSFYAPDPGRNIFAFYEPPPPCPDCPTPLPPTPKPFIPTPTPPMPFELVAVSPGNIYAGSKAFRMEVAGDRFTPDARIYFNDVELATTFINSQRLAANVPANLIAAQSAANIMVRTPDGKGYSLGRGFSVQSPPQPTFKYVGMIARRLGNNDTAYLDEGKPTPTGYRLNDVVAGRFRIVNISSERVVVEDTNLGFRHPVELFRPPPGTASTTTTTGPGGFPGRPGAGFPSNPQMPMQGIPGIPGNIPVYRPPNRNSNSNRPVDDEDDEDTDNR
ncbi:MAG: hypothetical protein PSX80_15490 [bacterium]|nr:hypothetical protein [bacterium]